MMQSTPIAGIENVNGNATPASGAATWGAMQSAPAFAGMLQESLQHADRGDDGLLAGRPAVKYAKDGKAREQAPATGANGAQSTCSAATPVLPANVLRPAKELAGNFAASGATQPVAHGKTPAGSQIAAESGAAAEVQAGRDLGSSGAPWTSLAFGHEAVAASAMGAEAMQHGEGAVNSIAGNTRALPSVAGFGSASATNAETQGAIGPPGISDAGLASYGLPDRASAANSPGAVITSGSAPVLRAGPAEVGSLVSAGSFAVRTWPTESESSGADVRAQAIGSAPPGLVSSSDTTAGYSGESVQEAADRDLGAASMNSALPAGDSRPGGGDAAVAQGDFGNLSAVRGVTVDVVAEASSSEVSKASRSGEQQSAAVGFEVSALRGMDGGYTSSDEAPGVSEMGLATNSPENGVGRSSTQGESGAPNSTTGGVVKASLSGLLMPQPLPFLRVDGVSPAVAARQFPGDLRVGSGKLDSRGLPVAVSRAGAAPTPIILSIPGTSLGTDPVRTSRAATFSAASSRLNLLNDSGSTERVSPVVKGNAWNAGADASGKKSGAQHQTPGMLSATAGVPDGTSRNSAGEEYPAALHGGAPADANAGQPNMTGPGSATPNLAAPNSVAQSSAAQNSGSQNAAWQNAGSQNMARMIAPPVSGPVPATPSSAPAAGTREATANEPAPVPLSTAQADAAPAGHFVSDAQLTQTTGRSEMRIALQSDNLGNIEVHARVSGDSLGANITVEKRDAHTALANELPALQQALCEKQLRVEQISLAHGPLQGTAGDSAAQQFGSQGQGAQRQAQNSSPGVGSSGAESSLPSMAYSFETAEIFDAQGRLSVLA